ncbi:MAG: LIC_13355 family lipoprotein [Leptospirales bacterium]|nr:LIC_13355 family lipoprotein [Leptospirales bacterium]
MKLNILIVILGIVLQCAPKSQDVSSQLLPLLLRSASASQSSTTTPLPAGLNAADTITAAPSHTGSGFCDSSKAINGIRGGGTSSGGFDVLSLNSTAGDSSPCATGGTFVTLEWAGKKVQNGTGIDFIVYENPFWVSGNSSDTFVDPVIVEVSIDGTNFCGFAPDYTHTPETTYSSNPSEWTAFAGRYPVLMNQETNPLDATSIFTQSMGGGDFFDLDNLSSSNAYGTGCGTTLRNNIVANGFTYIRLTAASARNNPDTGAAFVKDGVSNGPDIDGVITRYAGAR